MSNCTSAPLPNLSVSVLGKTIRALDGEHVIADNLINIGRHLALQPA